MAARSPREADLVTFRLPRELSQQLDRIGARDFETRSSVIRRLLRVGLSADQRPPARKPRSSDEAA